MTEKTTAPRRHRYPVRVFWEDTDAAGIVYYANYLKFCERARSDMVRRAGLDQAALLADSGLVFAVRRCAIDYLAAARLDDELEVVTAVDKVGGASVDLRQTVCRDDEAIVRAEIRLGCVDRQGKPRRLPTAARSIMADL